MHCAMLPRLIDHCAVHRSYRCRVWSPGDIESTWPHSPSLPCVLNTQTDNCWLFVHRPMCKVHWPSSIFAGVVNKGLWSMALLTALKDSQPAIGWHFSKSRVAHGKMGHISLITPIWMICHLYVRTVMISPNLKFLSSPITASWAAIPNVYKYPS